MASTSWPMVRGVVFAGQNGRSAARDMRTAGCGLRGGGRWLGCAGGMLRLQPPKKQWGGSGCGPLWRRYLQHTLISLRRSSAPSAATNLRAVELCERLRQQRQVALVLDLGEWGPRCWGRPSASGWSGRSVKTAVMVVGPFTIACWRSMLPLCTSAKTMANLLCEGSSRLPARCPCPACVLTRLLLLACADNTLVDAVSCTIAPNDWDVLDWRCVLGRALAHQACALMLPTTAARPPWVTCSAVCVAAHLHAPCCSRATTPHLLPDLPHRSYVLVTNSYGRQIRAQYAQLPGGDPYSGGWGRAVDHGNQDGQAGKASASAGTVCSHLFAPGMSGPHVEDPVVSLAATMQTTCG